MSGELSLPLSLIVRRTIRASADRLFAAWTEPRHLVAWWGPRPVKCASAEVDLRLGGRYTIVNALPDGTTLTIAGEFREIDPPRKLVYTWQMNEDGGESSLVTVHFAARADDTEVIVIHEQIPRPSVRDSHQQGWAGCLDSLVHYIE